MNDFPNLNSYGYQILEKIGNTDWGGSITWKARDLDSNQFVWVKQFCFATDDSTWSGYKAYQQEVSILKNLDLPGIPHYIESFETQDGFCLILKYIQAQKLNQKYDFTSTQVKLITKKILQILVYLQRQNPPILHQNINPGNILIDELENVYLVDFRFASNLNCLDDNSSSLIPLKSQTLPSKQSDLYSLGTTIISLLTNKKFSQLIELNNPDRIQFKSLISDVDSDFINWVEQMINTQVGKGFPDAKSALKALKEIDWDLQDNNITSLQKSGIENVPLSPQKYTFSTLGMGILGIAIAIGVRVTNRVTDKTMINFTIAAIAMVVVYLAQYGATTAFRTDPKGKTEAIIFAIATPIILTITAGIIFGRGETVAISLAAIIAQTGMLTTVLWHKLTQDNKALKIIGLLSAIVLGIIVGLKISV